MSDWPKWVGTLILRRLAPPGGAGGPGPARRWAPSRSEPRRWPRSLKHNRSPAQRDRAEGAAAGQLFNPATNRVEQPGSAGRPEQADSGRCERQRRGQVRRCAEGRTDPDAARVGRAHPRLAAGPWLERDLGNRRDRIDSLMDPLDGVRLPVRPVDGLRGLQSSPGCERSSIGPVDRRRGGARHRSHRPAGHQRRADPVSRVRLDGLRSGDRREDHRHGARRRDPAPDRSTEPMRHAPSTTCSPRNIATERMDVNHAWYGEDFCAIEPQWHGTVPGTFFGITGHGRRSRFACCMCGGPGRGGSHARPCGLTATRSSSSSSPPRSPEPQPPSRATGTASRPRGRGAVRAGASPIPIRISEAS